MLLSFGNKDYNETKTSITANNSDLEEINLESQDYTSEKANSDKLEKEDKVPPLTYKIYHF